MWRGSCASMRDKIPFYFVLSPIYQKGNGKKKHFNPTEAFMANRAVAR